MPTPLTDADKVLRNDTGKDIASKLDDIKSAILGQSSTLNNLSDVAILSLGDGQFLKYDSSVGKWINVSLPDPPDTLADLTDTNITAPQNEDIIKYDSTSSKWKNVSSISEKSISNVPIASFSDGGDNIPVKTLKVLVSAVQSGSGTPSPSNIRSISGWSACNLSATGKNIFNNVYPDIGINVRYKQIKVKNGTYTFSTNCPLNSGNAANLFAFGGYVTTGGSTGTNGIWNGQARTVTTTDGYITIGYRNDGGVDPRNYGTQIEVGSTATAYQAFGTTHNIPFNTTVYGGTLDVTKGVLTVTHQMDIFDGDVSENWSLASDGTVNRRFVLYGISSIKSGTYNQAITNYLSWATGTSHDLGTFTLGESTTYGFYIVVHDKSSNFADLATFKTYLSNNNLQLLTEMPTPVVVHLTPTEVKTIFGQNNIFADCGDIQTLEYYTSVLDNTFDLMLTAFGNALILENIDGSIASFTCGTDLPLANCIVDVTPVIAGSGTPSPDNVRAISGWSACNLLGVAQNLWDEQWELGNYSSSTGEKTSDNNRIRSKNKTVIKPNTTYFLVAPNSSAVGGVYFYDANDDFIGVIYTSPSYVNGLFTTPSNACYLTFAMPQSYGTTYGNNISLNYPSSDTSYHAYTGTTHNIPFNTTIYGGVLDVLSGVLTVDKGYIADISSVLTFTASTNGIFYSNVVTGMLVFNEQSKRNVNVLCSNYPPSSDPSLSANMNDKSFLINVGRMYIRNTDCADVTALNATIQNAQFVFPLATPTTIQLTPTEVKTIFGQNNIFADCGNIHIKYFDTIRHKLT